MKTDDRSELLRRASQHDVPQEVLGAAQAAGNRAITLSLSPVAVIPIAAARTGVATAAATASCNWNCHVHYHVFHVWLRNLYCRREHSESPRFTLSYNLHGLAEECVPCRREHPEPRQSEIRFGVWLIWCCGAGVHLMRTDATDWHIVCMVS